MGISSKIIIIDNNNLELVYFCNSPLKENEISKTFKNINKLGELTSNIDFKELIQIMKVGEYRGEN